ncbi:MAG: HNH endonuclease [Oryzomonas sp.]|jgi:putative restriction endonuclease
MIDQYIKSFLNLRTDTSRSRWSAATKFRAPHKPLLLLAVIDLIAQGIIKTNIIELTPDLGELFNIYWSRVMPPDQRPNIILPFFHLNSDKFWHHIAKPGMESVLAAIRQIRSVSQLKEIVLGVKLDEELFTLLCQEGSRNLLRTVLIETYFAPELHAGLVEQGIINKESFTYSQALLEKSRHQQVKEDSDTEKYAPEVRDQAFRRVIVRMYDNRCAVCGIRMQTPDCHTVVDAAHIVPWSLTHNDTVQNGMALCRLCHWTFDEGLITVSGSYAVLISKQLSASSNIPSHMMTLTGRGIIGPAEQMLWPDLDALHWHHQKIFRKY